MRYLHDASDKYPYAFTMLTLDQMRACNEWCVEQYGPMPPYDRWCTDHHCGNDHWTFSVHFKREDDAMWFKLRWYAREAA